MLATLARRLPGRWAGTMLASLLLTACNAETDLEEGEAATATVVEYAPVDVAAAPDALALLEDEDPQLAANKRLVFDMWRSVVNAGHVELADEMLQEDYIQHSPVLPTGRAAFKQIFSVIPRTEIPELVTPPLVAMVAEGDLVVMALLEELGGEDGIDPHTSTHFNLFRVEDGRLAEHWHSVAEAPGENVLPPDQGGPQPVTGLEGAAQRDLLAAKDEALAANKRLVFDALRDLYDRGDDALAQRYLAADFVEHDPNGFAARERAGDGEENLALPLVAMVADDDLVVAVMARTMPHPLREGATYNTTRFEMFRIEDGHIAEHWNGAARPGGQKATGDYTRD